MSYNLSWRDHIMIKVKIANRILGIIKRTCGRRPIPDVFLKLYIHLVRPHLEYACEVWSPYQAYQVDILEGVQRSYLEPAGNASCKLRNTEHPHSLNSATK